MTTRTDQREAIIATLKEFNSLPVEVVAKRLFSLMGYQSNRTLPITTSAQFQEQLDPNGKLTDREQEILSQVESLDLLFQLTDAELDTQASLFTDQEAVENTRIESYLFFAVELPFEQYTRTSLVSLVRIINKPIPMPALVLFKHGERISVGIIHRRLHKRNRSKDVLEKVTLIKDINCLDPIRAHVEILNDFVLDNLDADYGISNFVRLHEAWKKRLDSFALSKNFYREIADWYFWAHHLREDGQIRLPLHCDTEEKRSLFFIRLLTRVIFCWFLIEKRLIPTDLFREHRLRNLLKDFHPSHDSNQVDDAPTYYRAVLQNLFFGTLNMPVDQRDFRERKKTGEWYDKNYGVTNLWRYEDAFRDSSDWIELAQRIPFLNGGLFDCLDDKAGRKTDKLILDGFSDREDHSCHLPNDLFFSPDRVVDLSRDYGEEKKARARSKKAKVRGLVEILSRYKFTIEENTPLEEEIALDPELLGKVFENLLASYNEATRTTARKALGAFYTPREIVSYMVDEALKSYLFTQVPRCKGALTDLFSNKATLKEISPKTRDALIAAIGKVKILDPACGSGAFPMGALGRLVDLLQKLDPNNEAWKRDRLAETHNYRDWLEKLGADKEKIAECDARIADIEKSFDTRYHELDFARKLYLVEDCIYGVDIQPIATQIAKLRFFISLVVDQKVDLRAPNLGVRPLPNLETRLVAANALLPLPIPKERQGHLFDDADPEAFQQLSQAKAELASIRHEHFSARSPLAKRRWREADEAKRAEIAALLEENHTLPGEIAAMLARWNPYDQNGSAPFFDSEWMFGVTIGKARIDKLANASLLGRFAFVNGLIGQTELIDTEDKVERGFDIVIGNPPYNAALTGEEREFFKSEYVSVSAGRQDTAAIFVEAATRLSHQKGQIAFILPYRLFSRKRNHGQFQNWLLRNHHLVEVLYLGTDVGFTANDEFMVIRISRQVNPGATVAVAWKPDLLLPRPQMLFKSIEQAEFQDYGEINLNLLRFDRTILLRISESTLELQAICNVRDGIVPHIREHLVSEKKIDNRYVPFAGVSGRYLLEPFHFSYDPLWLCYDLDEARKHISDPVELRKVQLREKTIFLSRKIVTAQNSAILKGAIDEWQTFVSNSMHSTYLLKEQSRSFMLEYVLALLNSQVLNYFHDSLRVKGTDLHPQILVGNLKKLPIKKASKQHQSSIQSIVGYLIYLKSEDRRKEDVRNTRDPLMGAYWERVLNGLVYELYFPDELQRADIRLFDLVARTELPDIQNIPEPECLACLRKLFEELHDGAHPLRIALDKLQTLDTVRIIEGKE